ncbi:MAG TPA: TetR/AcrR family transcriptional regulator [Mesorhizobium sp.]|jgi:AcrR family transcriptional regulator|nr:TetR/AcrR family transcriptional regulator [Mesorhizobium sp.]
MDNPLNTAFGSPEPQTDEATSRAERRDQQAQRILEAAKACFVRSGFQGASMHQICAEVGMSPGALYRYFPSKESIIEAIAAADRKHDAEIMARIYASPSVVEGVVQVGMDHIRHLHDTGDAPLFTEIRAESMRNDAVRVACMACMEDVENGFRAYLQKAAERGEIDPCVKLDSLLALFMSIGEGMAINDLPARGIPLEDIETALRAIMTALLRPRETRSRVAANESETQN